MAVPPNTTDATNDAFVREVDEELRRDELVNAWRRYGRLLVVAVLVGLAAFGAWLYWQHYQQKRAGDEGEKLLASYDQIAANKPAPGLAELDTSHSPGYRATAKFSEGNALLKKNDLKAAAAKFGEIASDDAIAQPFRDLALIRQTSAEYDTLKPQVVVDRLRSLAQKGNPWFGSAGELVGIAYIRMNRPELARILFDQMSNDDGVPQSIRDRAVQMASTLGASANREKKVQ